MKLRIGYHFSTSGYSGKSFVSLIKDISTNYTAGQIFIGSPQQLQNKNIDKRLNESEQRKVREIVKKNKFKLFVHGSYMVNLARPLGENTAPLKSLIEELHSGEKIGAKGVVIHVGKTKRLFDVDKGIANMIENIVFVLSKIDKMKIRLLLESAAGVGSEIGSNLDEFSNIVNGVFKRIKGTPSENNFGICLDTAHLHSAGIDLRSKKAAKTFLKEFHQRIGLQHVKLIHFNDSEREIGSRVDRHAAVGMGYITLLNAEGMKEITQVAQKLGIPLILERSDKFHSELAGELELIKSWAIKLTGKKVKDEKDIKFVLEANWSKMN